VNLSIDQCNRSRPVTVKKTGPDTNWFPFNLKKFCGRYIYCCLNYNCFVSLSLTKFMFATNRCICNIVPLNISNNSSCNNSNNNNNKHKHISLRKKNTLHVAQTVNTEQLQHCMSYTRPLFQLYNCIYHV